MQYECYLTALLHTGSLVLNAISPALSPCNMAHIILPRPPFRYMHLAKAGP
jgi:hypothetical protein